MTESGARVLPDDGRPVLGILGGMGPGATNDFLERIMRLTPADRDQDHVSTVVYSDPSTPDRSDAILGIGPSPQPAMLRGITFLNQAGCAVIAIPCNSAHFWYDELAARSAAPIPHIVDATAGELKHFGARIVGVMATDGTCRSGVYSDRLSRCGMKAIDLTDLEETNPVMHGIRAYKAGDVDAARELLDSAAQVLIERGADALAFACTDVSAALSGTSEVDSIPVVDASECLATASLGLLGAVVAGRR